MAEENTNSIIAKILVALESLIPIYMQNPIDENIANGNVAVCIIDENGNIQGKMYGTNKAKSRQIYKIAWTKASQVWLTGIKTGEYEKLVFNKIIEENSNGIESPDLIGWEGGQPLILPNGSVLSVGFSGFRGVVDLEIMEKALTIAIN
jgi:glc operon protein GlcG